MSDITNNELNGINGTKGLPIEKAVSKISDDVWREMAETELARTVVALVGCVAVLEDKVNELERHLRGESPWIPSDGDEL